MPIILVVIGLIAALGLGGYFWETSKHDEDVAPTPIVAGTDSPVTETPTEPTPVVPEPTPTTAPTTPATTPAPVTAPKTAPKTTYKNAKYTVTVSYVAPDRISHPVTVTLTLANDIVTESEVTYAADVSGPSANYESRFAAAYKSLVVGQKLDSINLSRVGGASLTSNAWNKAKAEIAAKAQA
jgi:type IV secretory pathway VirB10-like protein